MWWYDWSSCRKFLCLDHLSLSSTKDQLIINHDCRKIYLAVFFIRVAVHNVMCTFFIQSYQIFAYAQFSDITCATDRYTCSNGQCIPKNWLCDGSDDCSDGGDERECKDQVIVCFLILNKIISIGITGTVFWYTQKHFVSESILTKYNVINLGFRDLL